MTIRSLEIYLSVIESGSMQAAAKSLHISAPSVSGAVSELERECGVRLFERFNRRLCVTEAGEQMRDYAKRLMNIIGEMNHRLVNRDDATPLRIGATVTVGCSVLLPLVQDISPQPFVLVNNTRVIEQKLLSNSLDIALVEGQVHSAYLHNEPVMTDELVVLCSNKHPWAGRKTATLQQLVEQPLLLREEGSGTRERLLRELEACHLEPNVRWECNNVAALLDAVRAGLGITVLSSRLAGDGLCVVHLDELNMRRAFALVYHKDKCITPAMTHFMDKCRSCGADANGAE